MNLFHLRYFLELVHTRHYTKAAQKLGITQPSLSHAISQLEAELGVPLFERNGRNTSLTCFGEEFLTYVENSLQILDHGISSLQHSAQGNGLIRLGFLRPLGVDFIPSMTSLFLKKYSELNIHFTFYTGSTPYLLDGLASHKYDLVFSSLPPKKYSFSKTAVAYQELVVIVPKNHPLSEKKMVSLEETLPYPYIYFSENAGIRNDIDALFLSIGQRPVIAHEIEEDQVIAGMVAHDFGIAIVPYMDILPFLHLTVLKIRHISQQRKLYMVYDTSTYTSPAVQMFQNFVLEQNHFKKKI